MGYNTYETKGKPLKLWDTEEPFEESAMAQLRNVAELSFIHSHVAGMADVHCGIGVAIGSVVPMKHAVIPAAVGVDIGCGMMAVQTTLKGKDLPDNLHGVREAIEKAVPVGRTDRGGPNDRGAWHDTPPELLKIWKGMEGAYHKITEKHPKARARNQERHLGTLGTGNHFIEMCLDEEDHVWALLHSGSRGPGNRIGNYFIEKAKEEIERQGRTKELPDLNLAYLQESSPLFADYIEAVLWAQNFALENRKAMMRATLRGMQSILPPFEETQLAVNCHHNYVVEENHFGADVWVARKGATRAGKGEIGVIPGSMGAHSFVVEGLGNPESFCSCSHGAGRRMSRTAAKKEISLEEHQKAMEGIEARLDKGVIDESPAAYKDITKVMKAQEDLVTIKHRLKQVVNVKG